MQTGLLLMEGHDASFLFYCCTNFFLKKISFISLYNKEQQYVAFFKKK